MNADERKMMRKVMAKVHPDLFVQNPYESQCNSDSLKLLFAYIKALSEGRPPLATQLNFYVKEGPSELRLLEAQLPGSYLASVLPLFFAFGLISAEQLRMSAADAGATSDTNFLSWMKDQVAEAIRAAEQHDTLKVSVRRTRADLERKYGLISVQVGAEYAMSLTEQERQLEALRHTDAALEQLAAEVGYGPTDGLTGLAMQLYHADTAPVESICGTDPVTGAVTLRTGPMAAFVAEDGCVHIVADPATLPLQLRGVEVDKARILGQVAAFWLRRVRELSPALIELLGVRGVWCDTKASVHNSQKFVLWAGYVLEKRDDIRVLLQGRQFSFSMIVHSDPAGPLVNFHASSPILNIRSDCPPAHLLEFLLSETGIAASEASLEVHSSRAKEEALLESVRRVFDAKSVIKICMSDKVAEGAKRLIDNAEVIKQAVDLRGACIALDDCYEVWDSGFISIPYNFRLQDLPQMVRRLQSGQRPGGAPAGDDPAAAAAAAAGGTAEADGAVGTSGAGAGEGSSPAAAQAGGAQAGGSGRRGMAPVAALPVGSRSSAGQGRVGEARHGGTGRGGSGVCRAVAARACAGQRLASAAAPRRLLAAAAGRSFRGVGLR